MMGESAHAKVVVLMEIECLLRDTTPCPRCEEHEFYVDSVYGSPLVSIYLLECNHCRFMTFRMNGNHRFDVLEGELPIPTPVEFAPPPITANPIIFQDDLGPEPF